jgi:hypothetical protein
MKHLQYIGNVSTTGILQLNRKRLQKDLLQYAGCSVELTIRKKNRRSNQQNRYYFGVVIKEIELRMKELGNDVDTDIVHEFFKDRFLQHPLVGEGGEIIGVLPGSTAKLNKEEFGNYIDKIVFFAAETLQITIPLPNTELQLF